MLTALARRNSPAGRLGGGAVLRNGTAAYEFFAVQWDEQDVKHLDVFTGLPKYQSFWEFLTLLLALIAWGHFFLQEAVTVLGDNTAALQNAIDMKGRRSMLAVARELAWRRAKFDWKFVVAHLPSEHNITADALSRLDAPERASMPRSLSEATRVPAPCVRSVWRLK